MKRNDSTLLINGQDLDLHSIWSFSKVAEDPNATFQIKLCPKAQEKILQAELFVKKIVQEKKAVYGINTGFGKFAEVRIDDQKLKELQVNIIRSHASGVGKPLSRRITFIMWLLRLNVIARGHSGIRLSTIKHIIQFLEKGILAHIPSRGSVGASGDLCPSAHATLAYLGEGLCTYPEKGAFVTKEAAFVLKEYKLETLDLGPKEGLSLINGTQLSTALAIECLIRSEKILQHANLSTSMMMEALRSSHQTLSPLIINNKNQKGAELCAHDLRAHLESPTEISESHKDCDRIQDNYSVRCAALVHGCLKDQITFCETILNREINSSTDNPLVFPEQEKVLSGGNFHALYPARCSDQLITALTNIASISERRIASAMRPESSRQLPFLTKMGGLNSGFMIAHVSSAALLSECKSLCFPASVDSIPTNDDREDHVSMGPIAGFKALEVCEKVESILAIELLVAAQGIDFLRPLKSSKKIESVHKKIRSKIPFMEEDRFLAQDIEKMQAMIESTELIYTPLNTSQNEAQKESKIVG